MQVPAFDSFAQARQEKRNIFQSNWNRFIKNPLYYVLPALLFAAQVMFFLSSVGFLREQAVYLRFIKESRGLWSEIVIWLAALVLSLPGVGFLAGLWKICRKTRWQGDTPPDISGIKLIKITNYILCIFTGILLALYPTIIITVGEYMTEQRQLRLFYLLMPFVMQFVLCISLVRIVIRKAEENITCCWADSSYLLPLILILTGTAAAVLIFFEISLFSVSIAALSAAYDLFLVSWWVFLKKTLIRQAAIDHKTIVSHENPNDPYNRYS